MKTIEKIREDYYHILIILNLNIFPCFSISIIYESILRNIIFYSSGIQLKSVNIAKSVNNSIYYVLGYASAGQDWI